MPESRSFPSRPCGVSVLLSVCLVITGGSGGARAQEAAVAPGGGRAPVGSGLYEGYSPILHAPYGPLDERKARSLPQWLEVTAQGDRLTVVLLPERRITQELLYGPEGLLQKTVTVNGKPWTQSRFRYEQGVLRDKQVTGPGIGAPRSYHYVLDEQGRIKERRGPISRSPFHGSNPGTDRVTFVWDADGATVDFRMGGKVVRRDRFDPSGRLLRTDVGTPATRAETRLSLIYGRDAAGRLLRVQRQWFAAEPRPAIFDKPDPGVGPQHLAALPPVLERHEVLLLLGQPVLHSRDVVMSAHSARDQYSKGCWLNQPSEITYDAAGMISSYGQTCICGFCVAASAGPRALSSAELVGTDEHWLAGPWLRLDERVDVTPEHRVLTPSGPRPAAELRTGDLVLHEGGEARPLRSIRRLAPGPERRGVNVRTRSGRFTAGGLLFESESPRACPMPQLTR